MHGCRCSRCPRSACCITRRAIARRKISAFARWVKREARVGAAPLNRIALVVEQPLPYLYLTRELFRSAGIPCQMFDELPLAAQPYAAALDLVLTFVSSGFARGPAIELLRSPFFRFDSDNQAACDPGDIAALDRSLAEAGYLGDVDALESMIDGWSSGPSSRQQHAPCGARGRAPLLRRHGSCAGCASRCQSTSSWPWSLRS